MQYAHCLCTSKSSTEAAAVDKFWLSVTESINFRPWISRAKPINFLLRPKYAFLSRNNPLFRNRSADKLRLNMQHILKKLWECNTLINFYWFIDWNDLHVQSSDRVLERQKVKCILVTNQYVDGVIECQMSVNVLNKFRINIFPNEKKWMSWVDGELIDNLDFEINLADGSIGSPSHMMKTVILRRTK